MVSLDIIALSIMLGKCLSCLSHISIFSVSFVNYYSMLALGHMIKLCIAKSNVYKHEGSANKARNLAHEL